MKPFEVVAAVRRVGAIGIFYDVVFTVLADCLTNVKGAWFAENSDKWEFLFFVSITEKGGES